MAPEILKDENSETDTPIDIWALGIILFRLLYGVTPFNGTS